MNKFAFIGHPIDLEHLYNLLGAWGAFARKIPLHILKNLLLKLPPYKYCDVRNVRSAADSVTSGHVLTCPFLPQQAVFLQEDIAVKKVIQAVRLAERLGAKIASLGGFTSVIGNEGEIVSKKVGIPVTSGNTYTACLAIEGIEKAAGLMDIKLKDTTMAIIGATGDIGSICTKVFSKKVKRINIVARNEKRLNEFADSIRNYGTSSVEIYKRANEAVKNADIVLTVTSSISVLITPEQLKCGAIICDVAIPANVAKEIVKARDDVLVFEGGLARPHFIEDIKGERLKSVVPPDSIYGCMAEGILLALENRLENYSLGRGNITEDKISEMFKIAERHGFRVSDFFCGYHQFGEREIEKIKENSKAHS